MGVKVGKSWGCSGASCLSHDSGYPNDGRDYIGKIAVIGTKRGSCGGLHK